MGDDTTGREGQGLSPETEAADALQIFQCRDLGGRVALQREQGVGTVHALAVVGNPDPGHTASPDLDVDPCRAGVERILDQLACHRRRPFDDLARRDAFGFDRRPGPPTTCSTSTRPIAYPTGRT